VQPGYYSNRTARNLQHTANQERNDQCGNCCALACSLDTTPTELHVTSNTQQTKNETTNVVIQQHSRKLLMMDIVMPET